MTLDSLKEADTVTGIKQAMKAVRRSRAAAVFVADDADAHVLEDLRRACDLEDIPVEHVDSMAELGKAGLMRCSESYNTSSSSGLL